MRRPRQERRDLARAAARASPAQRRGALALIQHATIGRSDLEWEASFLRFTDYRLARLAWRVTRLGTERDVFCALREVAR
jgi:hypothetical protein